MATIERGRQWRGKIVTADEIQGNAIIRQEGRHYRVARQSDGMTLLANAGSRPAALAMVEKLTREGRL